MKTATIEDLGYLVKQAFKDNQPKPIVFLGAGASRTGQIPLAFEIVDDILANYTDNPAIKRLQDEEKTYPKLMECLTPHERNKLLKGYIDQAKINVAHMYLAQFIKAGLIDYVLTVNFDNLMLRALALINEFPPTYDMAILKDLTTTSFKEKSVVYFHGQHHGLWLLNTEEEMQKVKAIVPRILDSIKNGRPWIFVGYSGQDPIFDHIEQLGRFDNGLYWVTYYDENPNATVCNKLLDKPNANTHLIKGYDADSFFMKLHNELHDLNLAHPQIIDKPFTSLKHALENIVDIDDKDHFKGVKERLTDAKEAVALAIRRFEEGKAEDDKDFLDLNLIKKQITDLIANEDYDENKINHLTDQVNQLEDEDLKHNLAQLYFNWAYELYEQGEQHKNLGLLVKACQKYEKSTLLYPKSTAALNNWGLALYVLAELKTDPVLYEQSIDKYQQAVSLNPKYVQAFNNWGIALSELAMLNTDPYLYLQSIEKYQQAVLLNPKYAQAFNNWGKSLAKLAKLANDPIEKDELLDQAFNQCKKAVDLGASSYNLACVYALKNDKSQALMLLNSCIDKGEITDDDLAADEDWQVFLEDDEFIALFKYR